MGKGRSRVELARVADRALKVRSRRCVGAEDREVGAGY